MAPQTARRIAVQRAWATRFLDFTLERGVYAIGAFIGMLVILTVSAQLFHWGQP